MQTVAIIAVLVYFFALAVLWAYMSWHCFRDILVDQGTKRMALLLFVALTLINSAAFIYLCRAALGSKVRGVLPCEIQRTADQTLQDTEK